MEQNDNPQGPNTDETAARENIFPEMKKPVVFEAPKITVANVNGKRYLFAADSFVNSFPEVLHCVYSVPDLDYTGPYFEKYVSDRIAIIEGAGRENKICDSPVFHHPHEVEMWPDAPEDK